MDDFLKKLSIYGSIAKEEGMKITQAALDKGRELAEIARLKRDIKIEEDMIRSYKRVIGEYVAANDLLSDNELVSEQKARICQSMENIAKLEEKLSVMQEKD